MEKQKKNHHHHRHKTNKFIDFFQSIRIPATFIILLCTFLLFCYLFFNIEENENNSENENYVGEYIEPQVNNNSNDSKYDGIITIIDGEGENTFSETWGPLIKDGYTICSNLVSNNVGKDGYYDWDTIKSLNEIGVEFVLHPHNYGNYNNLTKDVIISDLVDGKNLMKEHDLDDKYVVWIGNANAQVIEIGNDYFDGSFSETNTGKSFDKIKGNKPVRYYLIERYISYYDLVNYIDYAIKNHEWVVFYTRNKLDFMYGEQMDIFRKAFEYAKDHNVGLVGVQEGFDIYYGNKLGNE